MRPLVLGQLARGAIAGLGFGGIVGALPACSVDTLEAESRPFVANTCNANTDCGRDGVCTNGACYSRIGNIDEVLLEILPEATSPLGGISFLSMQSNVRRGDRARSIALPGRVNFQVQVQVNGEDLPKECPYLHTGKQTVAARVQYVRTGSVGGVSVSGLSDNFAVTVDTQQSASGFAKETSLVPGYYDIYAQPVALPNCQIAPKLWRGVAVGRDGEVVGWAPPAMLELPKPLTLNGRVERIGETLADWQVEILDPQEGKVISTSQRLGATTDAAPVTNFEIAYQPPAVVVSMLGSTQPDRPGPATPLIRLKPPKAAESKAPTVYLDLEATVTAGTGEANINLSQLPTPSQLVDVSGQVRGGNDGVRATVKFINSTFHQDLGLPASFNPAVSTDGAGKYETRLFPGEYKVIVTPEGAVDNANAVRGTNAARLWALTVRREFIGLDTTQVIDLQVAPTRIIEGVAWAGRSGVVAQGATLEAAPLIASSPGVFEVVINPPISPARASVPVDDNNGKFSLVLDPGAYDFFLKPAAASNFAWWILPKVTVLTSEVPGHIGTVNPQLLYPVPLEGTITVASQPLRNATVQAYARSTQGNVTKVGIARTDDTGHYYLALPPGFGSL